MNLLIGISIAFFVVGLLLAAIVVRLAKLEKQLDDVKRTTDRHEVVIMDMDEDPLKGWPKKDVA